MKDVQQIRRDNLFFIRTETGQTFKTIAEKIEVKNTYLSSMKNGTQPFTGVIARKIEKIYAKPFGWMDKNQDDEQVEAYNYGALRKAVETIEFNSELKVIYDETDIDGKTLLLDKLYQIFTDSEIFNLPSSSLNKLIGLNNNDFKIENIKGSQKHKN